MLYRVFIYSFLVAMSYTLFPNNVSAQPINDDFCNATALTIGLSCTTTPIGDLTGASLETTEPVNTCIPVFSPATSTVWYHFTAPASGLVMISANFPSLSNMDGAYLGLYEMTGPICSIDSLTQVDCAAGETITSFEPFPSLGTSVTPGQIYYIQVSGRAYPGGNNAGTFCIQIEELQAPANDDVCNAIAIPLDSSVVFSNVGATSIGEFAIAPPFTPTDFLGFDSWGINTFITRSIWYTFVAPSSGLVEIDLSDLAVIGNFNSRIALYSANDCNNLFTFNLLQAQDNYLALTPGLTSGFLSERNKLTASCLSPGETYYLLIDGSASFLNNSTRSQGRGILTIKELTRDPLSLETYVYDTSCDSDTNGAIFALGLGGANDGPGNDFAYSYQWSTGDSVPYLQNISPGIYTVSITDLCDSTYTTSYEVKGSTGADVAIEGETEACPGDMIELNAWASGGDPIGLPRIYLSNGSGFGAPAGQVFEMELNRPNDATKLAGDTLPNLFGLTYANGTIYGLGSGNQLYSVDPNTGIYTLIDTLTGDSDGEGFSDIDYNHASGTLIGNTGAGNLYQIDPSNATTVYQDTLLGLDVRPMAIDTNGVYYFSLRSGYDHANLFSFNPQNGTIDTIGYFDLYSSAISDLAVDPDDNSLYVMRTSLKQGYPTTGTGEVLRFNFQTGELDPISYLSNQTNGYTGLAIAPSVIEPYTYAWLPIEGLSDPNIANPTATVDSTTTWIVEVTDACGISYDTITVEVTPPALSLSSSPDNGSNNGTATATATGSTPFTYLWSNGDTTELISDLATGVYTVTATDNLGCSVIDSVEVGANVSIEDLTRAGINRWEVFPNPTQGDIQIKAELATAQVVKLSLHTITGQILMSKELAKSEMVETSLSTSKLSPGIYLLAISTMQGKAWQQLVVR